MKLIYALAEIEWLSVQQGGIEKPIQGRIIAPSVFNSNDIQWWSLFLYLKDNVHPGETTTLPVTTMVEEVAKSLFYLGAKFELKRGPQTVATGKIISTKEVSREQYNNIFHFKE